ncbi:DUF7737 domain-containing protein [Actinoplanes regularis]|uniref:DUF4132 domain-containing protein n=1 Tax=Actinoplanes regularis TaxID=52697 RepID=A0A239JNN3_9ACTN|nr:DUF4132 domain-containing protein [Actinoplanes regularis]GIE92104.1 hypothetical protein Are01nite_85840 [Actinoplanes regularis]SNT07447.1 protein of unknown function [Actinoplanes regularis]
MADPIDFVPESCVEGVRRGREVLLELLERARAAALVDLVPLADEIRLRMRQGEREAGGHLGSCSLDIVAAIDAVYDDAFPVRDPAEVAGLLDVPWASASRRVLLRTAVGSHLLLDEVTRQALGSRDLRLLRIVLHTPFGHQPRHLVARILDELHAVGALDAAAVARAFTSDRYVWRDIAGLACADVVRDHVDAMVWRLIGIPPAGPTPGLAAFPDAPAPRGLRFVRAALDWTGDPEDAGYLGASELTCAEQRELVSLLRERPDADRERVWQWRVRAGDDVAMLPLFDAGVRAVGPDVARRLLKRQPHELVSAVLGDNRGAVLKRVKNNALQGIAAFGMLPLAPEETVLDRYLALREVAKRGAALGPNRRLSHAAAVDIALDHLAQVTGAADASRLEWDCEARIAAEAPTSADVGGYRVELRFDGAEPLLAVSRAGKALRSVPAVVRADASYKELREDQERLREQARRMRTGLVERLVATAATLTPDELGRLRSLPAGAAMLPGLIWRDQAGTVGLLDEVDTSGPVTAVHPFDLLSAGELARWQEEIVRRRVRQPVRQVFRELYVLTPAERESVDVSQRFAGQTVTGRVAARLLSGRGWSTGHEYGEHQATRSAGDGLTAALSADLHGYWGMGEVLIGGLRFLRDRRPIPLTEVPPVAFSEVMRDLDLAVSVAGTTGERWGSASQAESRARVLAALITDLGLTRVTVDGTAAVVRGSRATYRVHLTSGSIHVEPAGYLCVVPAGFGATAHHRLFLPFADEDRMTSVILSKVLLLSEDDRITDPSILQQLTALT